MGAHTQRGFTIIETMLVLAITGMLVAGVFIGIGSSISVQRYRDAVETLKTTFQNQYAELSSVRNDRTNEWDCAVDASTSDSGSVPRGQSDCILVGRLVTIVGNDLRTYTVLGHVSSTDSADNDIAALRDNYTLNVSSVDPTEGALEWGAEIAWFIPGSGSPQSGIRELAVMFVRSPDSGQIYTFSANEVPDEISAQFLADMVVAGDSIPGQGAQLICISSNDLLANDDYSIQIAPFASVPNAVEVLTNNLLEQSGRAERC